MLINIILAQYIVLEVIYIGIFCVSDKNLIKKNLGGSYIDKNIK